MPEALAAGGLVLSRTGKQGGHDIAVSMILRAHHHHVALEDAGADFDGITDHGEREVVTVSSA